MNRVCVRPLVSIVLVAATAVACGQNGSTPSTPTTPTATQQTATPAKPSGATVSGTVLGVATSGGGVSTRATTLTVTVVGTNVAASVDGNGRFELRNVPPGRVELRFQGANVDARLEIGVVVDQQTVTITVRVNGSTATLENGNQGPGPNPAPGPGPAPNPPAPTPGQVEIEGTVSATSASGFTVGSRSVVVTAATKIERSGGGSLPLSAIVVGTRVEVKGTASSATGPITATEVEIKPQGADDDDDEDDEDEAEIKGTVSALAGSCAASTLSFSVASTAIKTNAATRFKDVSCAALKAGDSVEVKGTRQADRSVLASRVEKKR